MPGHERLLPRRQVGEDFVRDFGKLCLQCRELARISFSRGGFLDSTPELQNGLLELRRVRIHRCVTLTDDQHARN